jgi:glutamate racemase
VHDAARSIGVFDSGVGGLTVLRALRAALPAEDFVYLGDTARLPYGTKSRESIVRYSIQAADVLAARDLKSLVVACNTASAVALHALRDRFAPLPVIGVLEPGAQAAAAASRSGRIAVIGTEGTVQGGAYHDAIHRARPDAAVDARACPLFVALAEEGWTDGPIVEAIARRYLEPMFARRGEQQEGGCQPDVLVLGCTHFPVLADCIQRVVGPSVTLVDSAATTAAVVAGELRMLGLERTGSATGSVTLLATDGAARFARIGGRFFGEPVTPQAVEIVDL